MYSLSKCPDCSVGLGNVFTDPVGTFKDYMRQLYVAETNLYSVRNDAVDGDAAADWDAAFSKVNAAISIGETMAEKFGVDLSTAVSAAQSQSGLGVVNVVVAAAEISVFAATVALALSVAAAAFNRFRSAEFQEKIAAKRQIKNDLIAAGVDPVTAEQRANAEVNQMYPPGILDSISDTAKTAIVVGAVLYFALNSRGRK